MSVFLEHSNLQNSKRASIIASSISIGVQNLTFTGNEIDLLGLKFLISSSQIEISSLIVATYLVYIFIVNYFAETKLGHFKALLSIWTKANDRRNEDEHTKTRLGSIDELIFKWQTRLDVWTKFVPVILLWVVAIWMWIT